MRRVLLVCLMLLLPWQGAWAGMPQACGGGACPSQRQAMDAFTPMLAVLAQSPDAAQRHAAHAHPGADVPGDAGAAAQSGLSGSEPREAAAGAPVPATEVEAEVAAEVAAEVSAEQTLSRCTGDCGLCKIQLQPALPSRHGDVPALAPEWGSAVYRTARSDAPVETLLRPPSPLGLRLA